jgi:hypothetical protein
MSMSDDSSSPSIFAGKEATPEQKWQYWESKLEPINYNGEQLAAFYIVATNEICGTKYRWFDIDFPLSLTESMRVRGMPVSLEGPKEIIGLWLKKNFPNKELKMEITPFSARFGEETTGVFNLAQLKIEGTSQNDYDFILRKIWPYIDRESPYIPRKGIVAGIKRRLARHGF